MLQATTTRTYIELAKKKLNEMGLPSGPQQRRVVAWDDRVRAGQTSRRRLWTGQWVERLPLLSGVVLPTVGRGPGPANRNSRTDAKNVGEKEGRGEDEGGGRWGE